MAKFYDECMDSADWVEEITGYRPVDNIITLKELSEIAVDCERNGGDGGLVVHWDFPLSETQYLATEYKDEDEFILVRFSDGNGGYIYRWCEIDDFEGGKADD